MTMHYNFDPKKHRHAAVHIDTLSDSFFVVAEIKNIVESMTGGGNLQLTIYLDIGDHNVRRRDYLLEEFNSMKRYFGETPEEVEVLVRLGGRSEPFREVDGMLPHNWRVTVDWANYRDRSEIPF